MGYMMGVKFRRLEFLELDDGTMCHHECGRKFGWFKPEFFDINYIITYNL